MAVSRGSGPGTASPARVSSEGGDFPEPPALHPNPDVISPPHKAVTMRQGEMQVSTLSVLKCYTYAIFNVIIYQGIFK